MQCGFQYFIVEKVRKSGAFNAILFLLISLGLIARCISVVLPMTFLRLKRQYEPFAIRIMIWGGLRGGLAIALALALPTGPAKTLIVPMTYAVVLFSILVQGLSISPLIRLCKKTLKT
jgi:CPA1 family monovalent cation:H+ antiporter